jgi:hypothetical protein
MCTLQPSIAFLPSRCVGCAPVENSMLNALPHEQSHMSEVRKFADSSERLIAKDLYPFPSYTDILLSHHVDSPSK